LKVSHFQDYTYIKFCEGVSLRCNRLVHRFDAWLRAQEPEWLRESVPSYGTLALWVDRKKVSNERLEKILKEGMLESVSEKKDVSRLFTLPVRYGGDAGMDLRSVAETTGLSQDEVVRVHSSKVYTCYMLGFTPGFVYLGDVDRSIRVSRLPEPRVYVPSGSVGIAGKQTGFYGLSSPGGWRIIGRLLSPSFDVRNDPPSKVLPGDRVKFERAELM
jgi:inhibitor of KinA